MRILISIVALSALLLASRGSAAEKNPVLAELIDKGILIGVNSYEKLPAPTMPDGLEKGEQQKRLESIATKSQPLTELLRKSTEAPIVYKSSDGTRPDNARFRRMDVWFIAYGALETVADRQFLDDQAKQADEDDKKNQKSDEFPREAKALDEEALKARKLTVFKDAGVTERYVHAQVSLAKKVYVHGTARSFQIRTLDSVLGCAVLSPLFANDKEFPNQWQSIIQDQNSGKSILGPVQPYSGVGGYVKTTQLHEPAGALFVEYHLLFNEPHGWFNGTNYLASKLPTAARTAAVNFRKSLLKAKKDQAAMK